MPLSITTTVTPSPSPPRFARSSALISAFPSATVGSERAIRLDRLDLPQRGEVLEALRRDLAGHDREMRERARWRGSPVARRHPRSRARRWRCAPAAGRERSARDSAGPGVPSGSWSVTITRALDGSSRLRSDSGMVATIFSAGRRRRAEGSAARRVCGRGMVSGSAGGAWTAVGRPSAPPTASARIRVSPRRALRLAGETVRCDFNVSPARRVDAASSWSSVVDRTMNRVAGLSHPPLVFRHLFCFNPGGDPTA